MSEAQLDAIARTLVGVFLICMAILIVVGTLVIVESLT